MVRLGLWIQGRKEAEVKYPHHTVSRARTVNRYLILVMLTLVTWPGIYEPPSPGPSLLLR